MESTTRRSEPRKACCGLLTVLLLSAGLVATGRSAAAAAVDAVGTARCKLRGEASFSPPITNVARSGVTWSFAGNVSCRVGTTGMAGVVARKGSVLATSGPGMFSCSTTTFPKVTARILWSTNTGAVVNPTFITWSNPVSAVQAKTGLVLGTGGGQVIGSYAGQNNWLKLVGRKVPVADCGTPGGLAGYKVAGRDNPNGLYVGTCSNGLTRPARYNHVVVFQFQNRRWGDVGGPGFGAMPYLRSLASSCNYFQEWTEADPMQGSMVQNIAQMTGAVQPNAAQNCFPGPQCFSTANNIFRQLRAAGRTAVNYVEDTSTGCSPAPGFLPGVVYPHWVPYLYFTGADDPAYCQVHVRPYSEFNPAALPAFSFITPTECNIGHFFPPCNNARVDNWARANISRVINSANYRAGRVAVFVWYDEDSPVPNIQITPTATAGANKTKGQGFTRGHGFASTLQAWQSMLGLPCLGYACFAPNMRAAANI